jgi:sulfate adenylyltransferase subunit 2
VRIHPLLDWTEINVWEYIERENIPIIDIYFDKGSGKRYRSIGCETCTAMIESPARTTQEIIVELRATKIPERAGRAQDQEDTYAMEKLRREGYM